MRLAGLKTQDGRWIVTKMRVAHSFKHRLMGLLGTAALAEDEALMLSPGGSVHTFGMRYAIDVAFLDRQLKILRLTPHLSPWRFCRAPAQTRHVVELRAGMVDALQLKVNTFVCLASADYEARRERTERQLGACNPRLRFSLRWPEKPEQPLPQVESDPIEKQA